MKKHRTLFFIGCCVISLSLIAMMAGTEKGQRYIARMILSSKYNRSVDGHHGWVVPGRDGWLFYLDEIRYLLQQWSRKENEKIIERFATWLSDRNVKLIVIPIPTPLEVYSEKLVGFSVPELCPQRTRIIRSLTNKGVTAIDLLPQFMKVKAAKEIYLRTDTHPTIGGYEIIANEIARCIIATDTNYKNPYSRYLTHDSIISGYEGDMARNLKSGKDGYRIDVPIRIVSEPDGAAYADSSASDILLFGDSFLVMQRKFSAHLTAQVAARLNRPVVQASFIAGITQSLASLRRLLERETIRPSIIVWVFTARSLNDTIEF